MSSKCIVVTGAAGALGRFVAEHLSASGLCVAGLDIGDAAALPGVALQLAGVDLTDEASAQHAFDEIGGRFGKIGGLVNIAGGFAWETVAGGNSATWDRLFLINVKTALHACRAALPLLEHGGAIVNVGAAATASAEAGMGAYTASKSGVARLTEALAAELKTRRIRVNAVLPSIIDTPANRAEMPDADFGAWVTPLELANAIGFLLSDQASGITGAAVPVTGRVR